MFMQPRLDGEELVGGLSSVKSCLAISRQKVSKLSTMTSVR